jgi:hypothetical protein
VTTRLEARSGPGGIECEVAGAVIDVDAGAGGVGGQILEERGGVGRRVVGLDDGHEPRKAVVFIRGDVAVEVGGAGHHAEARVIAGAHDEVGLAVADEDALLHGIGLEDRVVGNLAVVAGGRTAGIGQRVELHEGVAEGIELVPRGVDGFAGGQARVAGQLGLRGQRRQGSVARDELIGAVEQGAAAHGAGGQPYEGRAVVVPEFCT